MIHVVEPKKMTPNTTRHAKPSDVRSVELPLLKPVKGHTERGVVTRRRTCGSFKSRYAVLKGTTFLDSGMSRRLNSVSRA